MPDHTGVAAAAVPVTGYQQEAGLRPARVAELIAPLSGAFDLAEGQSPGHSARVACVALALAGELGLNAAGRRTVLYAALLHDAGVAVGELPGGVDGKGGHTAAGAWAASRFGLDETVQRAIRCSHERWDGAGRPRALAGDAIPLETLVVSAAHWATDIGQDQENLLRARSRLQRSSAGEVEPVVGGEVARALFEVLRDDETWMALSDDRLAALVASNAGGEGHATLENVERVAGAMGEIVDAALRERGRSRRVALLAVELARAVGFAEEDRRAVRVAASLLDVGQLGVPRYINEKPAILSIDEMELMQRHPAWGARIIEQTPGMETVSWWTAAHHERPDGRGYTEMLSADDIPVAARILAVADGYWALRARRPHREAFDRTHALRIIDDNAGSQFDVEVVALLRPALEAMHAAEPASAD